MDTNPTADRSDIEIAARLRWCLAHCEPIPEDLASEIYSTVWDLLNTDERMYVAIHSNRYWSVVPEDVRNTMLMLVSTSTKDHWHHYMC